MTVGIVGSGPAVEAIESALGDVDVETERVETLDDAHELGIVVDVAGATAFDRANDQSLETDMPWIAVELGGIGGVPVVDAAVIGFDRNSGCYECLGKRVRSNVDPTETPTEAQPPVTARFAGAMAGRAAASRLDSDANGPDVFGQVIELPHEQRRFFPVPHCTCGGELTRTLDGNGTQRDVEQSLAMAEQGLDPRVGILQEVGEVDSYPIPYYMVRICDTGEFSDANAARQAAGVAMDWNEALMKGLGEAYERYAAGVYRTDRFREDIPESVENAVPPSSFVGVDDLEGAPVQWIEGQHLVTNETVHLPASLTFYPPPQEPRPASTTGLGFGNGTGEAVLSGLYEVIERDAAMLSWYSTFEPLELAVDDERFETLNARLDASGLSVTTLLLTQDVDVPVVACAVHRDGEYPRFAVGSSARLNPIVAARSAVTEATQNWLELKRMGPEQATSAGGAIGEFATFPEDARSFLETRRTVAASDVGPDDPPSGAAERKQLIERVTDADMTPYATRLTPRDVAVLGFEAVRVLVPAAQPLFLDAPYFGDRLESVPEQLGFEPRTDRSFHPFP